MTETTVVDTCQRGNGRPWIRWISVLVVVASVVVVLRDRVAGGRNAAVVSFPENAFVVTLYPTDRYGRSRLRWTGSDRFFPPAGDPRTAAALADAFRQHHATGAATVLRVAGGVRAGELEQVKQVLIGAAQGKLESFLLVLWNEPGEPEAMDASNERSGGKTASEIES